MPIQLQRGTYYGEPIAQREVAGLILTEKRHRAGERLPPHTHDHAYLCFVLAGSWREHFDGGVRTCAPRSVIYHPPGEIHSDDFGEQDAHLFAIELDANWLRRVTATRPQLQSQSFEGSQISAAALRLYQEARRSDVHSALLIEGLTLELLGSCLRSRAGVQLASAPRWIQDAEDLLRREFRAPPTLRALAAMAGVHRVHFARTFRAQYECTVAEFVRQLRLDFVCRELMSSQRRFAELAVDAGFADQSHMTKAFQRNLGTTPARFRAAKRLTQTARGRATSQFLRRWDRRGQAVFGVRRPGDSSPPESEHRE